MYQKLQESNNKSRQRKRLRLYTNPFTQPCLPCMLKSVIHKSYNSPRPWVSTSCTDVLRCPLTNLPANVRLMHMPLPQLALDHQCPCPQKRRLPNLEVVAPSLEKGTGQSVPAKDRRASLELSWALHLTWQPCFQRSSRQWASEIQVIVCHGRTWIVYQQPVSM